MWLHAVDDPDLAVPVADPWAFFADYAVDLPDDEAERMGITDPAQARVLVVVRVGPTPQECFANLKAPILVAAGTGHQVLNEADAPLRAPLIPEEAAYVLQLTRKPGQTIVIGDDIRVQVIQIAGGAVRLGIDAPRSVSIYREEIWDAVRDENAAAAQAGDLPAGLPERRGSDRRLTRDAPPPYDRGRARTMGRDQDFSLSRHREGAATIVVPVGEIDLVTVADGPRERSTGRRRGPPRRPRPAAGARSWTRPGCGSWSRRSSARPGRLRLRASSAGPPRSAPVRADRAGRACMARPARRSGAGGRRWRSAGGCAGPSRGASRSSWRSPRSTRSGRRSASSAPPSSSARSSPRSARRPRGSSRSVRWPSRRRRRARCGTTTRGTIDYVVRVAVVMAGSLFAVVAARTRERIAIDGERFRLLVAAAELGDRDATVEQVERRVDELLVPAFADACAIAPDRAPRTSGGLDEACRDHGHAARAATAGSGR